MELVDLLYWYHELEQTGIHVADVHDDIGVLVVLLLLLRQETPNDHLVIEAVVAVHGLLQTNLVLKGQLDGALPGLRR